MTAFIVYRQGMNCFLEVKQHHPGTCHQTDSHSSAPDVVHADERIGETCDDEQPIINLSF